MADERYTDEQIREEVNKVLSNPQLRQCSHCVHGADCVRCAKLNIPISKYQYCGHCQYFITNDELLIQETREKLAKRQRDEQKLNHILTMTLNSIEAAMLFLEDFEARVEKDYDNALAKGKDDVKAIRQDRAWIGTISRAYKAMKKDMAGVRRQYTHFIEPMLNKVFYDKETKVYDAVSYDDHMQDANELARIMMKYFDKSYQSFENAEAIEKFVDSMPGSGVMEESDYKRYNLRR